MTSNDGVTAADSAPPMASDSPSDAPGSPHITHPTVDALEQEQRRLARAVHDGPAQVLSNLALHSEIIERLIGVDNARAVREVRELRQEALSAAEELRYTIDQLMPPGLLQRDLLEVLTEHCSRLEQRFGLQVEIDAAGDLLLGTTNQETVFRVVQEALQNVLRHSGAQGALVRLGNDGPELVVAVQDHGKGFDPTAAAALQSGHFGIAGMRERAQLAGGTLHIASKPGKGTTVTLRLPR